MFVPPPAPRRRPFYAVSLAAHVALAVGLVVPPLLATPDPPEADGFVRIEHLPPLTSDASARETRVFLLRRKENDGGAQAPAGRVTKADGGSRARPAVFQPKEIGGVLPDPTGGAEDPLTFEESGERSELLFGPDGGGGGGAVGDGGGLCEGCNVISASAPGVTPPVALSTISPTYPELARRAHVEGVVVLEAIIDTDGSVRDVRVLRSASPLLDSTAIEAVRKWRYRPARIGARPVAVFLSVAVTFELKNL